MSGFELREQSDGVHLVGYASITGTPYSVGHYEETIQPGAFKRSLGNPELDVQLLVNHAGLPLARTTAGTLKLREDHVGLAVDATLDPNDPDVQSLVPKMRRGDVTEMSFAFRAIDQEWNSSYTTRLITRAEVHRGDVSVVSYGASSTTSAYLRHSPLGEARGTLDSVPLEERKRLSVEIGEKFSGGVVLGLRATSCNRCSGTGMIEINCPNCSGDGDVESASAKPRRPRRAAKPLTVSEVREWLAQEAAWKPSSTPVATHARMVREQREIEVRRKARERSKKG